LVAGAARAQQVPAPAPAVPAKTTDYFNARREPLPSAENAHYRVETTYRDSVGGMVREYYPGGSLREMWLYAHVKKRLRHGTSTTWYEDGKPHTKQDFVAGKRHGELLVYYPGGQLRRRDQFQAGTRTAGACFGPDGQPVPYFEYEQMPVYQGGYEALLGDIARSLRYPGEALRRQVQGKVFVEFVVDASGKVENVHVTRGLSLETDTEAVRVVRQLRGFLPGRFDGEPVSVSFTVPISFAIR
jgi:protein TonB